MSFAMSGIAAVPDVADSGTLTAREREVLPLIARGKSNKEIGVTLGISEATVKTHLRSIFGKLRAVSRAEAVAVGFRSGLICL